jgi:hypothetical protein
MQKVEKTTFTKGYQKVTHPKKLPNQKETSTGISNKKFKNGIKPGKMTKGVKKGQKIL